jgi:predicted TIM-barrel fold metal-dependent hydrolase
MAKTAIISVDGHVKASRAGYREYITKRHLGAYDEWVSAAEQAGLPDSGNLNPEYGMDAQWDSTARWNAMETQGVVAEVLFPNGQPFQVNRFDDLARAADPELEAEGRRAYNRWLADFCAETPGRRAGQAVVSFADTDQAIADVRWAEEHGLGGIMMPALYEGGTNFFDPALDPIWATIEEVGLPISQHGGAGLPGYSAPGFAAIMTVSIENGFYSNRSLWQMIAGGVFDRFPALRMAWVETQLMFIVPAINHLDMTLSQADEWMAFATFMKRDRSVTKLASEYVGVNCFVGVSPFDPRQLPIDQLVGKDDEGERLPGFHFGPDAAMFGVDYPHFESFFPHTEEKVTLLTQHPSVTHEDAEKILFGNAASFYGFDVTTLQPDIDRIGFDLADFEAPQVKS